jgi:hypothetical protein
MNNLDSIETFGGTDADTDELLEECFSDHDAYISARDHNKFLIIGRKGSGKTAIFRKLLTIHDHQVFTFGHTFSDYPWSYHDKQEQSGVPEEERYVHSWRYLILITLAKILLNHDQSQPWDDSVFEDMRKLEKFVVDTYGTRDPDLTQIFSPHRSLRFQSSFEIPAFKVSIGSSEVPMQNLPTVIQDVNQNLIGAITNSLNPDFDYYVCFDQLDLGFDPQNPNYSSRLIGLLLAARDINIKALSAKKKLSIIVFPRDDIYQTLRFEDKNKMTESALSRIEWDSPRSSSTLKQLMEKRFAAVLKIPESGAWEQVFNEVEKMTGRQTKYQHIIDRTFLRPRDIIKFCNETLHAYKNRPQPKEPSFDNRDVVAARTEYSSYFLSELDDEVFKHLPNSDEYLELLKSMDSLQFTKKDFIEMFNNRRTLLPSHVEPNTILADLFNFSLISFYSPGGSGYGGSEYVWRYHDTRAHFNEGATSFRIHPGLKEVLGLKRFTHA